MMLARHHNQNAIKIRHIAYEEVLREKFLELIRLDPRTSAWSIASAAPKADTGSRRDPSDIHLSEIIRLVDDPLAPLGDADQLRELIDRATLADLIADPNPRVGKDGKRTKNQEKTASVLPMVVGGAG
jgi:hypothetical protein